MITPDISKFRVFQEPNEAKYIHNYVSKNVLLTYYDQVKNITDLTRLPMEYLDTMRPSLSNDYAAFYDFFINSSTTREITTDRVSWKLKSNSYFKPTSGQNLHPELATPGIQRSEFSISLNYGGYTIPDIIYPELSPESQVQIVGNPIFDGAFNWIYNVKLASGTEKDYFDPILLAPNTKWCKLGAVHGEASELYGSFNMTGHTYLQFESGISSINKKVQVTDEAHNLNLAIRKVNASGQPIENYPARIISMIEAEFLKQIREEKAKTLWLGRSAGSSTNPSVSNLIDQSSGYPITKGPGVVEFLEDGNVFEYPVNNGSIDMISDLIDAVWYDSVPWANRKIVLYTGVGGLKLWESWIAEKFHGYGAQIPFDRVTAPTTSGQVTGSKIDTFAFNRPAFTEWRLYPAGTFTVAHLPILDSREVNGHRVHPETGIPMSSYEFIALDYGIEEGGPNIEMLHRQGSESLFYVCGSTSPLGAINSLGGGSKGFTASHSGGYYELFYKDKIGVLVRNIKRTMWFKPAQQ